MIKHVYHDPLRSGCLSFKKDIKGDYHFPVYLKRKKKLALMKDTIELIWHFKEKILVSGYFHPIAGKFLKLQ